MKIKEILLIITIIILASSPEKMASKKSINDIQEMGFTDKKKSEIIEKVWLEPPEGLFAIQKGKSKIYLGWRMIPYAPEAGYNIYRKEAQGIKYIKLNKSPIMDSTNYLDSTVKDGFKYYYKVRGVSESGSESKDSNIASILSKDSSSHLYLQIDNIIQNSKYGVVKTGDINGDGVFDYLIVSREVIDYDKKKFKDTKVFLYYSNGKKALEIDTKGQWHPLGAPWTLWDINGDGKEEIIGVKDERDGFYIYIMHCETGKILNKVKVPNTAGKCGYKNIAIAYLNGKDPFIIYQCGIYSGFDNVIIAFDKDLKQKWKFLKKAASEDNYGGSHQLTVADMDNDGKDEIFHGTYLIDDDGNLLWDPPKPYYHVDGVVVDDIRPDIPGLEVYMYVEQAPGGVHLLDHKGKLIWERWDCGSIKHAHTGWCADIRDDYPGMECFVHYKKDKMYCPTLISANGKKIMEKDLGNNPIDWDGDKYRELIFAGSIRNGKTLAAIKNIPNGYFYVMDIIGDYREEVIRVYEDKKGGSLLLQVYTNTSLINKKRLSPWEDRKYAVNKRWAGH